MTVSGKRALPIVLGLVITTAILGSALPSSKAVASQITPRKLILESTGNVSNDVNLDGVADGGSTPGATVNHHFVFTASSTTVQSIKFTYCTQARVALPCTTPSNMDASTAAVGALVGTSGWTLGNTTNNSVIISNTTPTALNGGVEITLDNIKNTDAANTAFYVDITTYTSTDASTGATDDGWVAAATANQIQLTGTMPESLVFCAGSAIGLDTNSLPDCTQTTNAVVSFNQLFSPSDTAWALSQMAASTNAGNGYSITVNGPTLTSGSNTVTAMDGTTNGPTSVKGTSQFGLNLTVNDATAYTGSPVVTGSADISPASSSSNLRGEPKPNYASNGNFRFNSGDAIADSSLGGAGGSDIQLYTISYIVNVNGAQQAGTYTTTLSYICTAQF